MNLVSQDVDKRWFLSPEDNNFREWIEEQNRNFAQRIKEVYFPDLVRAESRKQRKRDYIQIREQARIIDRANVAEEKKHKLEVFSIHDEGEELDAKTASARDIVDYVARKHGLKPMEIKGTRRHKPIVKARHEAIYLIVEAFPHYSYPMIGKIFGIDHTSVMYAHKKYARELKERVALTSAEN